MMMISCTAFAAEKEKQPASGIRTRKLDVLPEQDWQKSAAFPDWKGYTDDTLAMNSMISFRFYHGQGTICLKIADEVESFFLYVNGKKFDTSAMDSGIWEVDISGAVQDGMNTLQISNLLPLGLEKAIEVYIPYPVVLDGEGSLEGIHPLSLELISDIIETDIAYGFTSAQLSLVRNGRLIYENAWGRLNSYEKDGRPCMDSPAADVQTMYDLASVTKMFAANYAVQKLVTEGKLDVDAPLTEILGKEFAEDTLDFTYAGLEDAPDHKTQIAWKRELTVRDVLCHQAGFPDCPQYNNPDYDMQLLSVGEKGANRCYAATREDTLKAIFQTPLLYEPRTRTVYSDVDYMLVCFVIEKISGMRLDEYMRENFYEPMGLEHITFLPLENGFAPEDCAATELNGNTRDGYFFYDGIRTETLQGEVHDERASCCMEGVSGHAGLFASATDLAKLASVMLTGGYGTHRFFSRNVMDVFTAPKSLDFGQWGLGWWREGDDQRAWYFGTSAASNTIGHQGWTGTLAMVDSSRELAAAYLTNKINSPVLGADQINSFTGGCYTSSTLGFVPQILSIGMDTEDDISEQLMDLAADMAAESLLLIPETADASNPYVKNSLSKIEVLRKWAVKTGHEEYLPFADELTDSLWRITERPEELEETEEPEETEVPGETEIPAETEEIGEI